MPTLTLPSVSREIQDRLDRYAVLLSKWQAKINLVAPDTVRDAKSRHFDDSVQLLSLLSPDDKTLVDLGTGAGFPGLALAIACPGLAVHLVESDAKKCEFLKAVSRETLIPPSIPATIHNARIESVPPFPVDIVTARALASLDKLLGFALPFVTVNPKARCIFLKGENWQAEVDAARTQYTFDMDDYASITAPKSRILVIRNLSRYA